MVFFIFNLFYFPPSERPFSSRCLLVLVINCNMDEYVKEAFEELFREDGLVVFAQGLGITRLLLKFLHYYSVSRINETASSSSSSSSSSSKSSSTRTNPSIIPASQRPLVLCINATGMEDYILNGLLADGLLPDQLPKVITNEQHTQDRPEMYALGGCFLVTSRIMIVDLLDGKLDPKLVTGILVPAAHKISDTSLESFIIRVCFSDHFISLIVTLSYP